jgi:type IV fimbrial biogenesis protein FimT
MTRPDNRGFTLIELMITLTVIGITLAFSVPNFVAYGASQNLVGSADNIAAQLRLAREKAIATGQEQTFHIALNYPTTALL